ncbi:MAG: prepilin-type N-terminal cleavage/methylation domain-containing protein [Betaproteobacteria bacterium]|nr:prepilin-type N-terminal cleavage/methylation domain-containing protein [Betaproteobacteria bacterium]HSG76154.1 prepilin-type N-terminal cleavage/methylation domain-containing protein [Burkholderiales bacterium]
MPPRAGRGFTLIELIVVMAIVALLLTVALPRYFGHLDRSKEAVLRADLATMRDALDKHYADRGRYPERLEDLATRRYLRAIPVDPITESATTWIAQVDAAHGGVYNVRSGAPGEGENGVRYADW